MDIYVASVLDSQFLLNVVGTVLVDVQDNEFFRLHFCKLAADFASYASAAACNQDDLVLVVFLGPVIHDELLAPEEKLLHAEVPEPHLGSQVGMSHMGGIVDADLAACTLVRIVEFLTLPVVQAGREDYFLDVQVLEGLDYVLVILVQDLQVEYLASGLLLVHVYEAHGIVDRFLVGQKFLGKANANVACAENRHVDLAFFVLVGIVYAYEDLQQPKEKATSGGTDCSDLECIAVDHSDKKGPQKAKADKGRHSHHGNVGERTSAGDDEIEREAYGIEDHQPYVDLNASVSENLAVDLAEESACEDTYNECGEVEQQAFVGQAVGSVQQGEYEEVCRRYDHDVIDNQQPLHLCSFCLVFLFRVPHSCFSFSVVVFGLFFE